ncbi:vesicle transport protein SFT2A-like, partial [Convolutriloba macropyga]
SGGLGGAGSNLTYRSRLQAFAICLVAGILIETLGCTGMFMEVNKRTVLLFLIFTSVGNFAIITSTTFLASLAIQRRQLTEETRLFSGLVYVVMLLVSCAVALVLKNPVLVALAIFAKDFSIIWYSLTYIPLARAAMRQCLAA